MEPAKGTDAKKRKTFPSMRLVQSTAMSALCSLRGTVYGVPAAMLDFD